MTSRRFYVTTPIYYVNDRPHIGHVYTTTIADVLARYHRLAGNEVFFLTGVDEHAEKVAQAAQQRGLSPQDWADQNAVVFQSTFTRLAMTHDDFVRTSSSHHKSKVQEYVTALLNCGDVYLGEYEGWYDTGQEEYVTESKAKEYAYKSPITGQPLVRKTEKNYFFRLSAYRQPLLQLLEQGREFDGCRFDVQPEARRNEIIARIRDMEDVPISRTGTGGWGIPMPGDSQQTIYVWIDALFNYLTYTDSPDRRAYWQCGAVHLIAKDILWFHAAIWPAMLLALRKCPGYQWINLPRLVYAHSFWISEGQKMSKSLGNFIDLEKIDHYLNTFSLDALRWFLTTQGPLGTTDSDFAEAKFIDVYHRDLANTLGNCLSRVLNMIGRYFAGQLPSPTGPDPAFSLPDKARATLSYYRPAMEKLDLTSAMNAAMDLVRAVDNYIEQTQPFRLAKDPQNLNQVGTILYNCTETLRIASLLLWPAMPHKTAEIWKRLGCNYATTLTQTRRGDLEAWSGWGQLQPAHPLEPSPPLFPRHDQTRT